MSLTVKLPRLLVISGVVAAASVLTAGPAAAHVRVDEGHQPPKGGYGIVRLIVPTESQDASTVGLTVTLPQGVNLTSARTLPIPGWTATVETAPAGDGVRVSRIAWRAADKAAGFTPSEFGEFTFSAGPWPEDAETVSLQSDQVYSDGSVVAWNEIAVDKDSDPEHPAPVVTLGAAETGHDHDDRHGPVSSAAPSPAAEGSLGWRITSVVSLLVALGTVATLVVVLRRTRDTGS